MINDLNTNLFDKIIENMSKEHDTEVNCDENVIVN